MKRTVTTLLLFTVVGPSAISLPVAAQQSAIPGAPSHLTVEDRATPVGIDDPTPEFSWLPHDARRNSIQSAYRILVASRPELLKEGMADKWDSGKVESSACAFVSYLGEPLGSRDTCWWKVRIAGRAGRWGPWSDPARFELGLLGDDDWAGAQWIWRDAGPFRSANRENRPPKPGQGHQYCYFRKGFTLPDGSITRARAYVSSVHHHLLFLDGRLVGRGQNHENPERQYYQTFDLGPWLKPGKRHVLGARCHWFGDGQGRPAGRPGLLLKLVVDFSDGRSLTIGTDKTWMTRPTEWLVEGKPPWRNGEGIPAEFIDGRRYPDGWNLPGYDDRQWDGAAQLGPQPTAPWTGPLIAQESTIDEYEIAPREVERMGQTHYLADLGRVWSGRPKIRFAGGRPGAVVRIKVDYRLRPDGTLDAFAQGTKMDYEYTLRGGDEVFEPFWYLGFRYLEVEAVSPTETDQPPAPAFDDCTIRVVVRHHEVDPDRSSFECSNEMVTAVWELARRSAMLGAHECFVDTPTREQGQFVHDAYQASLASMKCFGERDLTQKALREFAHSQDKWHADTGQVNCVYPCLYKRVIPDYSQAWVFWASDYYRQTGDLELIGDIFDNLVRTGEFNKNSENKTTGLIDWGNEPGYGSGIVDWTDRYEYDRSTTQRTVLSCFAYLNYLHISRLAGALGRDGEARRFAGYAAEIRTAVQKHLWNDDKQAYVDGLHADGSQSRSTSQQANMVPLVLGFANADQIPGAMEAVKLAGFATAPMLVRFLVQAYGEFGEDEALMRFLTDPEGHNWARIIADDGSFTYESWLGRKGTVGNSESHPVGALGGVIAVQDYLLGVQPLEPGYARMQIRPRLCGLDYARGTVPTQRGPVEIDWRRSDGKLRLEVTIPPSTTATVHVPTSDPAAVTESGRPAGEADGVKFLRAAGDAAVFEVGSGHYVFESLLAGELQK